jgi:hypothetical protein
MTTPGVPTEQRGGARWYIDPATGERAPGVTSIIGERNKPFLTPWAVKVTAEFAYDHRESWAGLPRAAAVDVLKRSRFRDTESAAERGTNVHDIVERLSRGETDVHVPVELAGYVAAYEALRRDYSLDFVEVEATLWSSRHRYAGSCDGLVRFGGDESLVVLDWKTGKRIYPEVALQLNAYAHADYILRPDGSRDTLPRWRCRGRCSTRSWRSIPRSVTDWSGRRRC